MPEQPAALLAHPATQSSHRLAEQLARCGVLYEFWTGFAVRDEAWFTSVLTNCLPSLWGGKVSNRVIKGVPAKRLRIMPMNAVRQLWSGESAQGMFHERNQQFQERIPALSLQKASAVIGYDTSSWLLAQRVLGIDKPFFLQQSTPHPLTKKSLREHIASGFPEWGQAVDTRLDEFLACEIEEHRLATKIIVNSVFTKQSLALNGVDANKIVINPYGVDLEAFRPSPIHCNKETLRFVFVGAISPPKGVPFLLQAWAKLALKDAELWLVGHISQRQRSLIPVLSNVKIIGQLPRRDLPDLLRQCDVLVFPSFYEGFGMVLLEALATGLPIITTYSTAGPDLIKDGQEGRLIPAGNTEALCEAIKSFVSNRDRLDEMSISARRCAERFPWNGYGDRWRELLQACA